MLLTRPDTPIPRSSSASPGPLFSGAALERLETAIEANEIGRSEAIPA